MSGKPTLPEDFETRPEVHGAALAPEGMADALDEERAASMADEGGSSGMRMERQSVAPPLVVRRSRWPFALGALLGAAIIALAAWRIRKRLA